MTATIPGPTTVRGSVAPHLDLALQAAESPDALLAYACSGLADNDPVFSARRLHAGGRGRWLVGGAVTLFVVAAVIEPLAVGVATSTLITLIYAAALVHRFMLMRWAILDNATIFVSDDEARSLRDADLPVYTVLVPAYREPEVVAEVVRAMQGLEYPSDKLDVLLLLEADDAETIAAAEKACDGTSIRIVRVPPAEPRTKPKACNYGVGLALGEYVTIYDAEDRPEPLQLRRAVIAFRQSPDNVACLQAQLSYHNADQNLLTRWFTCEYDTWFRWLLPGLVASGAPIPLGGTSNHIRRDVLESVGCWDAYNVTEDADLGVRLARKGWAVAILGSVTFEEANSDAINWVKQRSRWYKGYLQTFLVHMRHPRQLVRELGWKSTLGFVLFVAGTPTLALFNPLFWLLTALWWVAQPSAIAAMFPAPLYHIAMFCWVVGGFGLLYAGVANARASGKPRLITAALVMPAYWALMSLAAMKALVQLIWQPYYWEKTTHGLATTSAQSVTAISPSAPALIDLTDRTVDLSVAYEAAP